MVEGLAIGASDLNRPSTRSLELWRCKIRWTDWGRWSKQHNALSLSLIWSIILLKMWNEVGDRAWLGIRRCTVEDKAVLYIPILSSVHVFRPLILILYWKNEDKARKVRITTAIALQDSLLAIGKDVIRPNRLRFSGLNLKAILATHLEQTLWCVKSLN